MEHSEGVYAVLLWFILLTLREALVFVAEEGEFCPFVFCLCVLPILLLCVIQNV